MDPIDRFAIEAELFARWAAEGTDEGAIAVRNGLLRFTRLYLAGLEIPECGGDTGTDGSVSVRIDDAEWDMVFAHAARLPFDYYGKVSDPQPVPPEESLIGSLADDIADIYRDVVTGLRHFQAGRRAEAIWQWTNSLQIHWGRHASSAIHALHCWLAANDPARLSADA